MLFLPARNLKSILLSSQCVFGRLIPRCHTTSFDGDMQFTQTWWVQQETDMWANSKPDNSGTNYTTVITQSPLGLWSHLMLNPLMLFNQMLFQVCAQTHSHTFDWYKFYPHYKAFQFLLLVGWCATWTNLSRAVLWGCYSFAEYQSLWLCYGLCSLVINCGMQLWNQNSLNLADLCFLWEENRIRSFSQNNKVLFLPCTQMDRGLASKDICQAMQGVHPWSRQESRTHCSLW